MELLMLLVGSVFAGSFLFDFSNEEEDLESDSTMLLKDEAQMEPADVEISEPVTVQVHPETEQQQWKIDLASEELELPIEISNFIADPSVSETDFIMFESNGTLPMDELTSTGDYQVSVMESQSGAAIITINEAPVVILNDVSSFELLNSDTWLGNARPGYLSEFTGKN